MPAAVGVPTTAPATGSTISPDGSAPDATLHVSGARPPVDDNAALNETPDCPPGTAVVAIRTGGGASSTMKASWRNVPPLSPPGSTPSVFSQFDVKSAKRPSCETVARGVYQNDMPAGSLSRRTSVR